MPPNTPTPPLHSAVDRLLASVEQGLRTSFAATPPGRPSPAAGMSEAAPLSEQERHLSGALMRVNHVGEVCAQALYQSQSLFSRTPKLRHHFQQAAHEEREHLAWTRERVIELGTHTSRLTPLWYAGAFGIGLAAGLVGDAVSLGFVVETERQVEEHLASHLERLPASDTPSRQIVEQMKEDEARHAAEALAAGALELPGPVRLAMRLAARVMTRTAHYI